MEKVQVFSIERAWIFLLNANKLMVIDQYIGWPKKARYCCAANDSYTNDE